jgi:hypothetical protein
MTKPKAPMTQSDLEKFVENDSDFAFEMRVLVQLRALGCHCEHSGPIGIQSLIRSDNSIFTRGRIMIPERWCSPSNAKTCAKVIPC